MLKFLPEISSACALTPAGPLVTSSGVIEGTNFCKLLTCNDGIADLITSWAPATINFTANFINPGYNTASTNSDKLMSAHLK